MKKTIQEIIGIILISSLFGIVYNSLIDKPVPLIYKKKIPLPDTTDINPIDTGFAEKDLNSDNLNQPLINNDKNVHPAVQNTPLLKFNRSITYKELLQFIGKPGVTIIDARDPSLFLKGHIGNALNIHPYEDRNTYMNKLMAIPDTNIIICYCDGGECDLSHLVMEDLRNFRFKKLLLFRGGWEEWEKRHGK